MILPIKATVFILGSSGFARELLAYIQEGFSAATKSKFGLRSDSEFYFVDDMNPDVLSVKSYKQKVSSLTGPYFSIMGSGKCDIKLKMKDQIIEPILSFTHPRAIQLGRIDHGTIIAPGAVIAPHVLIGSHVLCNYNCTVGHDTIIGDYSVISPGAGIGGNCVLGKAVYVGAGAMIRENINIGDGAIIGMNATVTKDVPSGATIIGVNERLK